MATITMATVTITTVTMTTITVTTVTMASITDNCHYSHHGNCHYDKCHYGNRHYGNCYYGTMVTVTMATVPITMATIPVQGRWWRKRVCSASSVRRASCRSERPPFPGCLCSPQPGRYTRMVTMKTRGFCREIKHFCARSTSKELKWAKVLLLNQEGLVK